MLNEEISLQRTVLYGAISLGLAFAMVFTPFGSWPLVGIVANGFGYIGVFFHELGHCVFDWLYGAPSLPSFDFTYGGGMTYHWNRIWVLQGAVWAGFSWLTWQARHYGRLYQAGMALVTVLLIWTSLNDWHEIAGLFMGHGGEAVMGAFLLMRGFWNVLLTRPEERWLNVVIGGFMVFSLYHFSWQLGNDPDFHENYLGQKGGHGMGDFTRIADFGTSWTSAGIGKFLSFFTTFCVAIALAAPWFFIQRKWALHTVEPDMPLAPQNELFDEK